MTLREPANRPDPVTRSVSELLVAEFAERIPPATVVRCVQAARHAVRFFGEEPEAVPHVLERIVRADLQQIVDGRESGARIFGVRRRSAGEAD